MPSPILLGPLLLDEPIGSGGMGVVWSGHVVDQDARVAVKVLSAAVARDPRIRAAFRTEVRAVAALHHPNVVRVLDHGEVPPEAASASSGQLAAGAPYLVMEYAEHGSLESWQGRLPWSRVREVLLGLLDALAHAHARGVIHRDLKPANVLLAGRKLRTILTDFGLAHLTLGEGTAPLEAGTPAYMAPEQLSESWRDYGPWTDLYAFGNVAAALLAGRAPLSGLTPARAWLRAVSGELPEVVPVVPVPEGLGDWLDRLLAAEPHDRFQRAADAAWALLQLGDAPDVVPDDAPDAGPDEATQIWATRDTTGSTRFETPGNATLAFDRARSVRRGAAPPLPTSWRPPGKPGPRHDAIGPGLGLFGLRNVPFVGRERERNAMWDALRSVADTGEPAVRIVSGPEGIGRSRLCGWIARRAHELGAAVVLWAQHDRVGGPSHGIAAMLERHHGLSGLALWPSRHPRRSRWRSNRIREEESQDASRQSSWSPRPSSDGSVRRFAAG